MVAVPLIHGSLDPHMYGDDFAADPRIDELRAKTYVEEEPRYTKEYMEPEKRSIGNQVHIVFNDGSELEPLALDYVSMPQVALSVGDMALTLLFPSQPVGHKNRRSEAGALLHKKLEKHLNGFFDDSKKKQLLSYLDNGSHEKLAAMPAHEFVDVSNMCWLDLPCAQVLISLFRLLHSSGSGSRLSPECQNASALVNLIAAVSLGLLIDGDNESLLETPPPVRPK